MFMNEYITLYVISNALNCLNLNCEGNKDNRCGMESRWYWLYIAPLLARQGYSITIPISCLPAKLFSTVPTYHSISFQYCVFSSHSSVAGPTKLLRVYSPWKETTMCIKNKGVYYADT